MAKGEVLVRDTSEVTQITPGTSGKLLTSNGVGVLPSFQTLTGFVTATGTLTSNRVVIGDGGSALTVLSSAGTSATVLHGGSPPVFGAVALATDVSGDLPYANLVPATTGSLLLGRGSTGAGGDWQEVTLGANLTMTGTVLAASASTGGAGSGDFSGPASAVAQNLVKFADATGKLGADAGAPIGSVPVLVTADTTIPANFGWVVPESLEIAAGITFEIADGARVEVTAPALPPQMPVVIVGTANQPNGTAILANDNDFKFTVAANAVYVIEIYGYFTSGASATPDVSWAFTFPSGTLTHDAFGVQVAGTAITAFALNTSVYQVGSPSTTGAAGVLSSATAGLTPLQIRATLRTGVTAGTLQFQWAQNTSTPATATVRQSDSWMRYTRVQ